MYRLLSFVLNLSGRRSSPTISNFEGNISDFKTEAIRLHSGMSQDRKQRYGARSQFPNRGPASGEFPNEPAVMLFCRAYISAALSAGILSTTVERYGKGSSPTNR